eukprot:TRINITY_DN15704_c0_g1_i1.p1 TRINITY_DN15704_c0_g1~~TRINITY_DN15704_c0_g1_i1.p1  ORF type:complete len:114 (-),score=19.61 TRINITY_DN15704_c0_g1_i1:4-345(-)
MKVIDSVNEARMQLQQAIAKAFNAKEIMDNYANKEPEYLRGRISLLESELHLKKISRDKFLSETHQLLERLGKIDSLTNHENEIFKEAQKQDMGELVQAEKKELSKQTVFGMK